MTRAKTTKPPDNSSDELTTVVADYCESESRDLWVYSGNIRSESADQFIDGLCGRTTKSKRLSLFLTTYGGDPHSGYKIARCLRASYENVRIIVVGPCKSAGTLIALGADEIAFGIHGELGPLDMQMLKPGELANLGSGLDTLNALETIRSRTFDTFMGYITDFMDIFGPLLPTAMQFDTASKLTDIVIAPIAAQIDPFRLGEASRTMEIGRDYARRLMHTQRSNVKSGKLTRLVESYSSHGFVIDEEEAREIFTNIHHVSICEQRIYTLMRKVLRNPQTEAFIVDLAALSAATTKKEETSAGDNGKKPKTGSDADKVEEPVAG